jgi:hypothetical protein
LPRPLRRLESVECSFVLPWAEISRRPIAKALTFDISTHPGLKPLRAELTPCDTGDRWAKITLSVDIMSLFGLPALLSCVPASLPARLQSSGSTGGTGSLGGEDAATGDVPTSEFGTANPWLQICNASGNIVACITPKEEDGICILHRQDQPLWDVSVRLGGEEDDDDDGVGAKTLVAVSLAGKDIDIGRATKLRHSHGEYLQVDTQLQAQGSETPMLLMTMLAALGFHA